MTREEAAITPVHVLRGRRFSLLAAAATSTALHAAPARGADRPTPTSSLSWVELPGAESCGGALLLSRLVEEQLGRHALVPPAQADQSIEGYVEHRSSPPFWRAAIVVRDPRGALLGDRSITSSQESCDELRSSAALVIALIIDPDAVAHAAPPVAPGTPAPAAGPGRPPPSPAPPEAAPRAQPWRLEADADAVTAFGLLPNPAFGIEVGVTLRSPSFWRTRALGGALFPQRVHFPDTASAQLSLGYAGLALCPLALEDRHRWSLELCAGAIVGALGNQGSSGFATSKSAADVIIDLIGTAAVVLPLAGPVVARAGARLGVTVRRDDVVYEDTTGTTQTGYVSPSLFAGTIEIGLGVVLP